jgi:phosphoribosylaminoimidazole carboxylase PurE protein
MSQPLVGIVYGSTSDRDVMQECANVLDELGIAYEQEVMSAHRTPDTVAAYAREAAPRGLKVLIAGAGLAAHLAGAVAANSVLPVIGVPLAAGTLGGLDALLSTVQMPPGVPVATVAIGTHGARNAAWLAARILALQDNALAAQLSAGRVQ